MPPMLEIMDLKSLQAPLKARYREEPAAALVTLHAEGSLGEGVTCSVETGQALVKAGLHPATGGTPANACSGDMLLQALVACAGVTMSAVATSLGFALRDVKVRAEGDLDFRGRPQRGGAGNTGSPDRALLRRPADHPIGASRHHRNPLSLSQVSKQ